MELVGVHHHFLLEIHRHIVGWWQRQLLAHHILARKSHAGMVAAELGDGLVHALVEQILVALKTVQNVAFLAEFERFAVRAVMLEHAVGADVMQQSADEYQMLVEQTRWHMAAGDACGGRYLRVLR